MNTKRVLEQVPVDRIRPSKFQARQTFDEAAIKELEDSMRENSQSTPLLLRPGAPPQDAQPGASGPWYELVSGEQRFRAAKNLRLSAVWAVIEDMTDQEAAFRGLVENVQRRDLNPLDRATFYRRLMNEFHLTQQQLAAKLRITEGMLSHLLRLLDELPQIQEMLAHGALTERHCRALAAVPNEKKRVALAKQVVEEGLSAKETEKRVQKLLAKKGSQKPGSKEAAGSEYNGFRLFWKDRELVITKRNYKPDSEMLDQYFQDMRAAAESFLRNEPRKAGEPAVLAEVSGAETSLSAQPQTKASTAGISQDSGEPQLEPQSQAPNSPLLSAEAEDLWKRAASAIASAFGLPEGSNSDGGREKE